MRWLLISIALSVVLTVFLNVGLRAFPNTRRRVARGATRSSWTTADETPTIERRVRLWMPWKAMIVGSVILTIVVNLVLWIGRG